MFPTQTKLSFAMSGKSDMALRPQAFELFEGTGMDSIAESAKSLKSLARPFSHAFGIFEAAGHGRILLARFHRENKLDAFNLGQLRHGRSNCRIAVLVSRGAGFVDRLGRLQKQTVVGFENCARAAWFGRKRFESASSPGKNFVKGRLARYLAGFGVDHFTFVNPNFSRLAAIGDAQNRGALRNAFQ